MSIFDEIRTLAGVNEKQKMGSSGQAKGKAPMPKTSTRYNSEEFIIKNPKNNKQLNPETINCILSFSKTFKVKINC